MGLRLSGPKSGNAIHRLELRAADPPRLRHQHFPCARDRRDAAAGLTSARAPDGRAARPDLGRRICADRRLHRIRGRPAQRPAIPHYPPLSHAGVHGLGASPSGARDMALIRDFALQGAQMLLVLVLSPLLTGFVRKVKARLLRRQGPPLLQPYRDLIRLMRKDVVLATSASWLFRVIPYIIFAGTWVAASLVPTFRSGLLFSWSADLIAIIALLGSARFFQALAGLDVGTSFGGIGSSREVMIASLAEPAMLMIVFTLALVAGSTQLSSMAAYMVSIAENARIPIDNPATHLELTMVHEAMVLEYSGRHLALIDLSSELKLLLYISLIGCLFAPWGIAGPDASAQAHAIGVVTYLAKLAVGGFLLAVFETAISKMRVFRVPAFLGAALMLGLLATLLMFVSRSL